MDKVKEIINTSLYMRNKILDVSYKCKLGVHLGGGMSIVEIMATLYTYTINYDKYNTKWDDRDRFILSKGHGVLGYYAALLAADIISEEEFFSFQTNESNLIAHPVMNMDIGIESSNGSLGQGLSMAIGIAIAAKNNNKRFNVYTLMGDGECDEGSVWEAIMLAPSLKLDNLVAIIDYNKLQSDGSKVVDLGNLSSKIDSFGWDVYNVDGHDIPQLIKAFDSDIKKGKPKMIVANTIKGKVVSFMENDNDWHHNILTASKYEESKNVLRDRYEN